MTSEIDFSKMNITMKDGGAYIGMIVIDGVTNIQEKRLLVRHPVEKCFLVLNWQDIREVYVYEDNDE